MMNKLALNSRLAAAVLLLCGVILMLGGCESNDPSSPPIETPEDTTEQNQNN